MSAARRDARTARQLFRLCLVDGRLDQSRVRQVVAHVARSPRRRTLDVLDRFARLVRLDRQRHSARVETAEPLSAETREDVRSRLSRTYGPDLRTTFAQDTTLIGGMRVTVGSDVYDGSIRARLAELEARF